MLDTAELQSLTRSTLRIKTGVPLPASPANTNCRGLPGEKSAPLVCRVWTVDSGYNESSRRTSVPMSAAAGPGQHSLCCYDPSPGSGTDLVADHGNIADTCHQPAPAASRCCSSCSAVQVTRGEEAGDKGWRGRDCYHMLSWGSLSSAWCWYTITGLLLLLLVTKVYSDSL